jgi:DNA primase
VDEGRLVRAIAKKRQELLLQKKPTLYPDPETDNPAEGQATNAASTSYEGTPEGEDNFSFEQTATLDRHEKSILYYVIRYGEIDMENVKLKYEITENPKKEIKKEDPLYVIQYIIEELERDDLNLTHPLYRQILEEASRKYMEEGFRSETYFRNHIDPQISKIAAELSTDKYIESKIHSKFKDTQREEEEKLKDLVPYVVINYKNAVLQNNIDELNRQIQEAGKANDIEQINSLFKELSDLIEMKKQFAHLLRERIIK